MSSPISAGWPTPPPWPHLPIRALYIHIPFCHVHCTYCAFNIYTRRAASIPDYLRALAAELRWLAEAAQESDQLIQLDTIYLGGGTPSLLSAAQIGALLDQVRAAFSVDSQPEITLEVNPEVNPERNSAADHDRDYFKQIRDHGVNRLSIGMQSAIDSELRRFARMHTLADVTRTVNHARQAGHDNLSLDLIYGAPLQTLDSWQITLDAALNLQPDHLSLYALQVEAETTLARWIDHGRLPMPDDDLAADLYALADDQLLYAGLQQYEISTWAAAGHECRHNLHYWHNEPFLGIGAGATGSTGGARYKLSSGLDHYIRQALSTPETPRLFPHTATIAEWQPISRDQAMDETVMTALRLTREGLDRAAFVARFGVPVEVVYADSFARLATYDMLAIGPERIRLRPAARLISNQVLVHFMRGED